MIENFTQILLKSPQIIQLQKLNSKEKGHVKLNDWKITNKGLHVLQTVHPVRNITIYVESRQITQPGHKQPKLRDFLVNWFVFFKNVSVMSEKLNNYSKLKMIKEIKYGIEQDLWYWRKFVMKDIIGTNNKINYKFKYLNTVQVSQIWFPALQVRRRIHLFTRNTH